jgi:hypothetical protein
LRRVSLFLFSSQHLVFVLRSQEDHSLRTHVQGEYASPPGEDEKWEAGVKALARLAAGRGFSEGSGLGTGNAPALDELTLDGLLKMFGKAADEVRRLGCMNDCSERVRVHLDEGVVGEEGFGQLIGQNAHQ